VSECWRGRPRPFHAAAGCVKTPAQNAASARSPATPCPLLTQTPTCSLRRASLCARETAGICPAKQDTDWRKGAFDSTSILILFPGYCAPLIYAWGTGPSPAPCAMATGAAITKADVFSPTPPRPTPIAHNQLRRRVPLRRVPSGVYDLTVTAKGFNKFEVKA